MEPGKVSVHELFSEFGTDETEDRKLDARLWQAIHMTRAGNWVEAVGIFQEYLEKYPDYDVPHIWLAEFANQSEGAAKAVEVIRSSAARCRRKSELLEQAAELSLLKCHDLRGAIHLFAQSIAAHNSRPRRNDIGYQRACLFLKEIFIDMEAETGVEWADSMQHYTNLNGSLTAEIHQAIKTSSARDPKDVLPELLRIFEFLRSKFPVDKPA